MFLSSIENVAETWNQFVNFCKIFIQFLYLLSKSNWNFTVTTAKCIVFFVSDKFHAHTTNNDDKLVKFWHILANLARSLLVCIATQDNTLHFDCTMTFRVSFFFPSVLDFCNLTTNDLSVKCSALLEKCSNSRKSVYSSLVQ